MILSSLCVYIISRRNMIIWGCFLDTNNVLFAILKLFWSMSLIRTGEVLQCSNLQLVKGIRCRSYHKVCIWGNWSVLFICYSRWLWGQHNWSSNKNFFQGNIGSYVCPFPSSNLIVVLLKHNIFTQKDIYPALLYSMAVQEGSLGHHFSLLTGLYYLIRDHLLILKHGEASLIHYLIRREFRDRALCNTIDLVQHVLGTSFVL